MSFLIHKYSHNIDSDTIFKTLNYIDNIITDCYIQLKYLYLQTFFVVLISIFVHNNVGSLAGTQN